MRSGYGNSHNRGAKQFMKWEYRWIKLEKDWHAELNAQGKDGWELVTVHHFLGKTLLAFFKRQGDCTVTTSPS
jgi:hypothetical protein